MNNLKDEGQQKVIEAQEALIKSLTQEIRTLCRKNLKLKMHMQVLVSHPVGLASMMIAKQYSPDLFTKELQMSTQN